MRNKFGEIVSEYLKTNEDSYFITADAGNSVVMKYMDQYPGRCINVGIAEQNMAGVAAGLAMEGKLVILNSIGNFPTLRCYEQIRNDIAYHNLNVKICATGGGLSYGPAGVTHHLTEDFTVMRAIPGMMCFTPGDPYEVEACTWLMLETPGPCYMRVGYHGEPTIHKAEIGHLYLGAALEHISGNQAVILSAGSVLSEAYQAAVALNAQGISTGLYSFPGIKPMDAGLVQRLANTADLVVTVEENVLEGGFGSAVAEIMAEQTEPKARLKRIGLSNQFPEVIGDVHYLREYYQINAKSIIKAVRDNQ